MQECGESFHQQENGDGKYGPEEPATERQDEAQFADTVQRHRQLYEEVPRQLG